MYMRRTMKLGRRRNIFQPQHKTAIIRLTAASQCPAMIDCARAHVHAKRSTIGLESS